MLRGIVRPLHNGEDIKVFNASIHNKFEIEVRDAATNEIKQRARAFNVVCDNLWSNLSSYFNYIVYSNGSGTPSSSDKTVFGTWYGASASNHELVNDLARGVSYRTRKITLSETTSVGVTITEVGLAYSNSSGYLCTHAMIQDMNGNQISITKTATDIITIYATVYVHWIPTGYKDDTIVLAKPVGSGIIGALLGYGFSGGDMYVGKGTCKMTSTGGGGSCSYNKTTKNVTCKATRIAVGSGNITGGFGWIALMAQSSYSSSYSCTVYCVIDVRDRYEVTGEAVGTGDGSTTNFATSFDFPSEATVYIDGVAQASGVTVKNEPVTTDPFEFLVRIEPVLYDDKPIFLAGTVNINTTTPQYFYNTQPSLGFYKWTRHHTAWPGIKLSFSDDFINWSDYYSYGTVVPEEYRHCKYIRMLATGSSTWSGSTSMDTGTFPPSITGKNIVFDEAPPEGSIITIDYITPFVPKDVNHVYDFSMSVQFSDYTG